MVFGPAPHSEDGGGDEKKDPSAETFRRTGL
jgi:hypothetical protein